MKSINRLQSQNISNQLHDINDNLMIINSNISQIYAKMDENVSNFLALMVKKSVEFIDDTEATETHKLFYTPTEVKEIRAKRHQEQLQREQEEGNQTELKRLTQQITEKLEKEFELKM